MIGLVSHAIQGTRQQTFLKGKSTGGLPKQGYRMKKKGRQRMEKGRTRRA